MYRTDKQFMKNPATAPSRIYIGNLAETVVPDSIEEKFSRHGKILGLVLQRGFGFIQFENEGQAQLAINNEHGTMFHGRKVNVRQAIDNRQQNSQNKFPNNKPPNQPNQQNNFQNNQNKFQNQNNYQQRNPPPEINRDDTQKPPPLMQQHPPPEASPKAAAPPASTPQAPQQQNLPPVVQQREPSPNLDEGPPEKRNKRNNNVNNNNNNNKRMPMKRDFRDDYRDDMRDVPPPYYDPVPPVPYGAGYHPPPIVDRPERNDCEIIVVSKALTEYAEYIEQRLKTLGLIVDLLFPNEDVPIGRVLANISSRGCLYAILVMPQNEEHRSLTLNILHGIAEEHRNMPIDDAFMLLTRNFEAYMRGEKFGVAGHDADKMTLTMRHPEHIQVILNLLAENRQVNSTQYDKLINYIQEKRELQSQFEVTEGIDTGAEPEGKSKQAELQNRIMNILNKKGEEPKIVEPPKPASGPTPLLNDPSVQKALDSLLLGDMFKGLTS